MSRGAEKQWARDFFKYAEDNRKYAEGDYLPDPWLIEACKGLMGVLKGSGLTDIQLHVLVQNVLRYSTAEIAKQDGKAHQTVKRELAAAQKKLAKCPDAEKLILKELNRSEFRKGMLELRTHRFGNQTAYIPPKYRKEKVEKAKGGKKDKEESRLSEEEKKFLLSNGISFQIRQFISLPKEKKPDEDWSWQPSTDDKVTCRETPGEESKQQESTRGETARQENPDDEEST